jgi:hypothetical protein
MLKTVSSVINAIGALNYKGTWDASTNNPTLTSSVGTKGDYYVVSVSGSTNLNGITDWVVGDWAVFNGSIWQKVDNSEVIYVSNVATGTGLTGGPITTTGTISLANTAVTPASYGSANTVATFTVDQQGRLTAAANVTIAIANTAVSGLGTMSTQNSNAVVITGGTINAVAHTDGSFANANITSVAATFPNSYLSNSTLTLGNTTLTLGGTVSNVGNLTLANVTIATGSINVQSANLTSTTTANATYGIASLPLQPAGFIQINLNGTVVKVPYYAV